MFNEHRKMPTIYRLFECKFMSLWKWWQSKLKKRPNHAHKCLNTCINWYLFSRLKLEVFERICVCVAAIELHLVTAYGAQKHSKCFRLFGIYVNHGLTSTIINSVDLPILLNWSRLPSRGKKERNKPKTSKRHT